MPAIPIEQKLSKLMASKVTQLAEKVAGFLGRRPIIMEVCGTHTMVISRSGLKSMLSEYLELRSGPGCPVCVTDQCDCDAMISLARHPNTVIATFGDMMRVPGTFSSLEKEKALGAWVEVFYSPADAVSFAGAHPEKEVIFLGVGFETTAPAVALSIASAAQLGLKNYSVFSVHKKVPPVMHALLSSNKVSLDGLILPGHVCTITGSKQFDFIAKEYNLPAVISGFEPVDLLNSIYILLNQILSGRTEVINGYTRLVSDEGNKRAQEILQEYFTVTDASWRGFGLIKQSGLAISGRYSFFDASLRFPLEVHHSAPLKECYCGNVLQGELAPYECPLFGSVCTPLQPVGPCMVSSEGSCSAYFQYESGR